MNKIIAIGNNKGGVAKTTTAVNLVKGLADRGHSVLLIDADSQGNATAAVGFDEPDMIEDTLASVMLKVINDEDVDPNFAIHKNQGGFYILPGNIDLSELEVTLVNVMDDFNALKGVNPDIIGWINIPGTSIDYPILKAGEGKDDRYYLRRTYEGKNNSHGSIFIEKNTDSALKDDISLIYGRAQKTFCAPAPPARSGFEQSPRKHLKYFIEINTIYCGGYK